MKRSLFMVVVPLFFLVLFLGVSNVICASPGQPEVEWSKTFGGENWDEARSVIQTSDGGYALAGVTMSYGAGEWDFWLVKTVGTGEGGAEGGLPRAWVGVGMAIIIIIAVIIAMRRL